MKWWPNMPRRSRGVCVSHHQILSFCKASHQLTAYSVLITGPSDGGIGAETALCLASQSPSTLILAGRNKAKIQPVIDKITQLSPDVKSIFVELDLSSQTSVRSAAAEINAQVEHIDVLINNAAIMACPFSRTEDNLEIQFGTNFIGPFLFTGLLLPKIRAAGPGARIVNVSSSAHRFEGIRFEDLDFGVWILMSFVWGILIMRLIGWIWL